MSVRKAVESLDSVSRADVEVGSAKVTYDDLRLSREDIEAAIVKAGYRITG
jgi:copper chaperone CopZ